MVLGPLERITPVVGLISVGEVVGIGIKPIIYTLAGYLFLLLPYEKGDLGIVRERQHAAPKKTSAAYAITREEIIVSPTDAKYSKSCREG